MSQYRYNCVDKSLLLPYFKKYYVALFFKIIPKGLTANFITLVSTGFIFLMLYASTLYQPENTVAFAWLIAFCLHSYVVGDHLDGMQAKVTKTSSPLGEYLDHYLDVFNGAIVVFVLTVFFGPLPKPVFYWFLVFNALSFAVTMVEELERQKLVFGILGTLEGIIFLILFFITWGIEPVKHFWNQELYQGYPRYWLVIIFFALGYIATIVDVIRRIGYIPRQFIFFVCIITALAYILYQLEFESFHSWLIITLFSGEYISKVMESYLIGKKHKFPDLIISFAVILIIVAMIFDLSSMTNIRIFVAGIAVYLGLKVVALFILVVFQLKQFWFWVNPSL